MATNNNTLADLLNRPFVAELIEGKHRASLKSWTFVDNQQNPDAQYIRCTFDTENDGKQQEYNRNLFMRDVSIALSHLRRQLNMATETINPVEFLDNLVKTQIKFDFWITYEIVASRNNNPKRVQNIAFQAPLVQATTLADMELPPE